MMHGHKIRIATPNDDERRLLRMLSPMERLAALLAAARKKLKEGERE